MSEDMATAGGTTEEYLTAEQAAQELVASLRDLREVTQGYIAAEKKLEDVGKRLSELADATRQSGERVVEAAEAVRAVSGPEILAQIHTTQTSLGSQHGEVVEAFAKQTSGRADVQLKQETSMVALARQVRTVTYIAAAGVVFAAAATLVALLK